MTIGEKIKKYRDKAGVSREQLADALHETVLTLDLLESGRVTPTDEEIQRICEVLSVSKEEFLRDDDTTESATTVVTAERDSGENYVFKFDEMQIYELRKTISGRATLFWGVTWVITLLLSMIFFALGKSGAAGAFFVLFFCTLFVGVYSLSLNRRGLKELFEKTSETTYVYQVLSDYFVVKQVRNHENVSTQKVYFADVKQVKVYGSFLCVVSDGKLYLFNKNEMVDNSALFALSKRKIVKDKCPQSDHKGLQVAGVVFFVFSILSLFAAIATALIVANKTDGNPFENNWWIMLCFMPFPITSIVLGFCLRVHSQKYQGNIIAGVVVVIIMFVAILFGVMFNALSNYVSDTVGNAERQLGIDIPQYRSINVRTYTNNNDGNVWVSRTTDLTFTDENVAEFENRLRYDGEWRLYSVSDLGGLPGIYSEGKQYTYYIVYNVSQKTYNSWPSRNGTFCYINVLYNKETNSMRIVEYVLIYGN